MMQVTVPVTYVAEPPATLTAPLTFMGVKSGGYDGPNFYGFTITGYPDTVEIYRSGETYYSIPDSFPVNVSSTTASEGTYVVLFSYTTGTNGANFDTSFSWPGPDSVTPSPPGSGQPGCN